MIINCHACVNGTTSNGETCSLCGGDGEIDLQDHAFRRVKYGPMKNLTGLVWNTILTNQTNLVTKIDDLTDKVDDVMDKCNDIFEKVSE